MLFDTPEVNNSGDIRYAKRTNKNVKIMFVLNKIDMRGEDRESILDIIKIAVW